MADSRPFAVKGIQYEMRALFLQLLLLGFVSAVLELKTSEQLPSTQDTSPKLSYFWPVEKPLQHSFQVDHQSAAEGTLQLSAEQPAPFASQSAVGGGVAGTVQLSAEQPAPFASQSASGGDVAGTVQLTAEQSSPLESQLAGEATVEVVEEEASSDSLDNVLKKKLSLEGIKLRESKDMRNEVKMKEVPVTVYKLAPFPELKPIQLPKFEPYEKVVSYETRLLPDVKPLLLPDIRIEKVMLPPLPKLKPLDLPKIEPIKEIPLVFYEFPPWPEFKPEPLPEFKMPKIVLKKFVLPPFPEFKPLDLPKMEPVKEIPIVMYELPPLPEVKPVELPKMDLPEVKVEKYHLPPFEFPKFPEINVIKYEMPPKIPEVKVVPFEMPPAPKFDLPEFKLPELTPIELPPLPEIKPLEFPPFPEFKLPELPKLPEFKFNAIEQVQVPAMQFVPAPAMVPLPMTYAYPMVMMNRPARKGFGKNMFASAGFQAAPQSNHIHDHIEEVPQGSNLAFSGATPYQFWDGGYFGAGFQKQFQGAYGPPQPYPGLAQSGQVAGQFPGSPLVIPYPGLQPGQLAGQFVGPAQVIQSYPGRPQTGYITEQFGSQVLQPYPGLQQPGYLAGQFDGSPQVILMTGNNEIAASGAPHEDVSQVFLADGNTAFFGDSIPPWFQVGTIPVGEAQVSDDRSKAPTSEL